MSIIISGVGRIGKDAVLRASGSDKVVGFSLAMDNGFGDKKQTIWFDCSGWGKRYEAVCEYLLKGSQVFVSGEYGEREHDDKVYNTIRLQTLDLVGSKPSGERQERQPATASTHGSPAAAAAANADPFPDDDIPF